MVQEILAYFLEYDSCPPPTHPNGEGSKPPLNAAVHGSHSCTCLVHAEYREQPGLPSGEWVLTDTAEDSQLGTEQRLAEKEEITGKAGIHVVHSYLSQLNACIII